MATTTFVAMNHRGPMTTALTLEAAQRDALRDAKQTANGGQYDYFWVDSKPFVTRPGEWLLMRKPKGRRTVPAEKTAHTIVEVALTADEKTVPVDGPFPVKVRATPGGAELDVSAFLFQTVFTELITKADDDPEGLVEELAGMADLLRSAVAQGRDSSARHAFDGAMQALIKEVANDGAIPVYGAAVGRLAGRLSEIAAPRRVPGQRGAA